MKSEEEERFSFVSWGVLVEEKILWFSTLMCSSHWNGFALSLSLSLDFVCILLPNLHWIDGFFGS